MAEGRSTKIISMIKWILTSRLSIKVSLSLCLVFGTQGLLLRIWPAFCQILISIHRIGHFALRWTVKPQTDGVPDVCRRSCGPRGAAPARLARTLTPRYTLSFTRSLSLSLSFSLSLSLSLSLCLSHTHTHIPRRQGWQER